MRDGLRRKYTYYINRSFYLTGRHNKDSVAVIGGVCRLDSMCIAVGCHLCHFRGLSLTKTCICDNAANGGISARNTMYARKIGLTLQLKYQLCSRSKTCPILVKHASNWLMSIRVPNISCSINGRNCSTNELACLLYRFTKSRLHTTSRAGYFTNRTSRSCTHIASFKGFFCMLKSRTNSGGTFCNTRTHIRAPTT